MADKKITVRDLKTFIEAVEFASDSDSWVPSERQWKKIREMIDNLDDTSPVMQQPVYANAPTMPFVPAFNTDYPVQDMRPVQLAPSGLSTARPPASAPVRLNEPRTPDIDTSHGKPYQSSFA